MIRALWFVVKVAVLVAAAVWVAQRPGTVFIEWMDYTAKIHVGFFLILMISAILLAIFLFRLISWVVHLPQTIGAFRAKRRQEKGYRALTLGLTAVAAGDTSSAVYQAHRATTLLPEDKGLPVLLNAQAARLDGREEEAHESFIALLENKDTSFLGVRGLLQAALDAYNYPKALELARQALKLYPKQPWILRTVYDLEIRLHDWPAARKTLYRAEKAGAVTPEKAASDRVAMLLADADAKIRGGFRDDARKLLKKAQRYNPVFVPTIKRLAGLQMFSSQRRAAVRLLEKAWKVQGHPELARLWEGLMPVRKSSDPLARLKWMEKLITINPKAADGYIALAGVAKEQKLFGEAREYLQKAANLEPSAPVFKSLADIEERMGGSRDAVKEWMDKAHGALPGKCWVCCETGRIYDDWHAVAEPHGSFNTINWDYPGELSADMTVLTGDQMEQSALEAPKA